MRLKECRLANGGGDLYHPDIPVSVSFSKEDIFWDRETTIKPNDDRFVWLTDKQLRRHLAYRGLNGLQVIRFLELPNTNEEGADL